jgi:predicted glycoside hydrolase/deacetylase ChbG (UPF0249 family)
MSAQQVGDPRHSEQHDGQNQVVALPAPGQQEGVGRFVDTETARRNQEKTPDGSRDRRSLVTEGESMMAREGDDEGHQPTQHVGRQRVPALATDESHDDAPMHGRRGAPHSDKPPDTAPLQEAQCPSASVQDPLSHVAAEHSGQRAICIAVDDFGQHAGINQAALRLAEIGRAQAIGCMVGGPSWTKWNHMLRPLDRAHIDLGLHLDFTETPLLPGTLRSLNTLIRDSFLHQLDRRAVRAEIKAQLDAFELAIGRAPAYIDGHQHVHQFPVVRDELLAELAERYGAYKPWLRSTRSARKAEAHVQPGWRSSLKPWIVQSLGAAGLASAARELGYPQNGRLLGVYDFAGGPDHYSRLIANWLSSSRQGDLLMCHPSVAIDCADPMIDARRAEFDVLSSPAFEAQLRQASVTLQQMSRMLPSATVAPSSEAGGVRAQGGI